MRQRVSSLSGGEQSRLLIAKLMLEPANLLVLDEPTNDLDLPTLSVLEDALVSFEGGVLLVTHDRYFLDQVATELLAFETLPGEAGSVTKYSDLAQWEAARAASRGEARAAPSASAPPASLPSTSGTSRKLKKLSFNDQRDYDSLERRILEAEARLGALEQECELPDVISDASRLVALDAQITAARAEIDRLYARWAELEALLKPPA
jgi:ATP-binding cassette subfamily F protein uup